MSDIEIWLPVVGYENRFLISSHGRLKSLHTSKVLKTHLNRSGYEQVCVSVNNKKILFRINILVGEAFVEKPIGNVETNHKDCNRANNHYSNIEWITHSENIKYSYDVGYKKPTKGEANGRSILTEEQVNYCRSEYIPRDKLYGCRALARKFNVSHVTMSNLLNNKSW